MGESILFDLAGSIVAKLGSFAYQELKMLRGVRDELDKLKDSVLALQAVLHDAEEQQSKGHRVKDWVSKLKDVFYGIDDLMDEFDYEALRRQIMTRDRRNTKHVRIFFSKSNHIAFRLKMGSKIKEIRERLKAIDDDKTQFSFSEHVIDMRYDEIRERRETGSYIPDEEVIGRNDDKKAIVELLLNTDTKENIALISIVGMGGLGKTALAQSVYNYNTTTKHFELKLWVCVSEEFDVRIIIQKILESVTGKKSESSLQMDLLQNELRRQIDGKKYLLVMDDVWNEDHEKWVDLKRLLMGGAKGSRILITTRSEQVAHTFDTSSCYPLENLDECNSWLLFKKVTFLEGPEEELENSNLVEIGKEIVKKLKGVPLAIRTIGRLLYAKKSKKQWLSFKDKDLYQVMEQKDLEYIRSILELSYKHLPSNLKQCFLYCALFPKDYMIQKDELILHWRAQGFIQSNDKDNLIDTSEDYFMELLSRSFFQDVIKDEFGDIKACKMHDLMHDLACSITENDCVHGIGNDINKRTHHFSLGSTSWKELEELPETLSKARNLRTFFLQDFVFPSTIDFEKVLHNHLQLRMFNLILTGENQNTKFFESISKLKHLRYLRISGLDNEYISDSITELYNLETLILQGELKKLPSNMGNLINLKNLDLYGNAKLQFLPESITELCKLEVLILGECLRLKGLPRDVKNWLNLRHLDLSSNYNIEFLPNSITQLNKLEKLLLSRCSKLKELPGDTKKLINLKHLDLSFCMALTHMPKGLGELTSLQTMNNFVLGKDNGGELSELNELNKLMGNLYIGNLQCCTSLDLQITDKFLQLKSGLRELLLDWDNSSNESEICDLDDGYDERVLHCLQPHSNLREISIYRYGGVKLCNWLSSHSLGCLVDILLDGCKRLQHLPQLDQFPYLKKLYLIDLPCIEYIGNNDSFSASSIFFPSLEKLKMADMPKLKRWWNGTTTTESTDPTEDSFPIIFPRLSELEIGGCPLPILMSWHAPLKTLKISDIEEEDFDVVPWKNFENLSLLKLSFISKLEYLPKCLQHATTLQSLRLWFCENLKSLPEWINDFTSLTRLTIVRNEKLTSLPEGISRMHCLQSLTIIECPKLEERYNKETGEDWPKIAHIPSVGFSWIDLEEL